MAVVAVVLAVAGLVYLIGRHDNQPAADGGGDQALFHHDSPSAKPSRHAHRHPHRHHQAGGAGGAGSSAPSWIVGIPMGGGGLHPGVDIVPGVLHHAVLTVTSNGAPIALKYAFRTASGFRSGQTATSSSWRADAQVRGAEPLAGLIAQVASGSITCTASIDGHVVDQKSNAGRFATVSCYA